MDTTPKSQKNIKFIRVLQTRYIIENEVKSKRNIKSVMQTYKHDIPRNKARDSGISQQ